MSTIALPTHSKLSQDAVNETYKDLERMLFQLTHKAARRFGVRFEDLLPAAQNGFVYAYRTYNPNNKRKAKFVTWCYFVVNKEIANWMEEHVKHSKRSASHVEVNDETLGASSTDAAFRSDLEAELSDDAKHVVHLILDTPEDIRALYRFNKANTSRDALRCAREHLMDIGWSASRVVESFNEIRALLGNSTTPARHG